MEKSSVKVKMVSFADVWLYVPANIHDGIFSVVRHITSFRLNKKKLKEMLSATQDASIPLKTFIVENKGWKFLQKNFGNTNEIYVCISSVKAVFISLYS